MLFVDFIINWSVLSLITQNETLPTAQFSVSGIYAPLMHHFTSHSYIKF